VGLPRLTLRGYERLDQVMQFVGALLLRHSKQPFPVPEQVFSRAVVQVPEPGQVKAASRTGNGLLLCQGLENLVGQRFPLSFNFAALDHQIERLQHECLL
jgi:hypothetical protein